MSELEEDLEAARIAILAAIRLDEQNGEPASIVMEIKKARRRLKLAQESIEG